MRRIMDNKVILAKRYLLHELIPPTSNLIMLNATDLKTNVVVAVKIIRKSNPLQAYYEIVDYYKMGLELSCKYIQEIYDVLENKDYTAIVFQKIMGESLKYDPDKAHDRFVVGIASALIEVWEYLERVNYPLRHNITKDCLLLVPDGRLFVSYSFVRAPVPNHGFSAPETYSGIYNELTDIFFLGLIMLYLATGVDLSCPSFDFNMKIHKTNRRISKKLEKIIHECIAIDAKKRIQSLEQAKEKLLRLKLW